ncbi:hypothetical protein OfM1_09950 [Lactovum odontotermitis]
MSQETSNNLEPKLKQIVQTLKTFDDLTFGEYQFRRDALQKKVTSSERQRLIAEALQCGKDKAREIAHQFAGKTPSEITEALGITVKEKLTDSVKGYILLARYTDNSGTGEITLMADALEKLDSREAHEALGLKLETTKNIILSHEIFHHLESQDSNIFTQTTTVNLWKIFGHQQKSHLRSLSEIAAMSFSWNLLQLTYSPQILEIVTAYQTNQEFGLQLYDELVEIAGNVKIEQKSR